MPDAQKLKLVEMFRLSILLGSMLFASVVGYTALRGDVKHMKEKVLENKVSINAGTIERQALGKAVTILTNEIKNVNKNLEKIEKKL